jgi:uncharacterized damage-inducible protein DinB
MKAAELKRLYAYTDWANERVIETIEALSDEQRAQVIPSSFPSILETLTHVTFAEWVWLRRFRGESPTAAPEGTTYPEVLQRLRAVAAERRDYLDELSEERLAAPLSYRSLNGDPFSVRLSELLVHVANHSTYHRGQLVTMLRQLGVKPQSTDYVLWVRTVAEE